MFSYYRIVSFTLLILLNCLVCVYSTIFAQPSGARTAPAASAPSGRPICYTIHIILCTSYIVYLSKLDLVHCFIYIERGPRPPRLKLSLAVGHRRRSPRRRRSSLRRARSRRCSHQRAIARVGAGDLCGGWPRQSWARLKPLCWARSRRARSAATQVDP